MRATLPVGLPTETDRDDPTALPCCASEADRTSSPLSDDCPVCHPESITKGLPLG
jgi:hypothetical protein